MAVKFANLASSTLASSLTNSATSISVNDASSFPTLGAGDYFYASIGEGSLSEIVKVTAVSSNTLTAVRGQDGTTARSHDSGTSIALRVVAAALDDIASAADTESVSISGDTMTGGLILESTLLSRGHSSGDNWMPYTDGNFYIRAPLTIFDNNVRFADGSGILEFSGDNSGNHYLNANSGQIRIRPNGTTTNKIVLDSAYINAPAYQVGGTEVISSSRNATLNNITLGGNVISSDAGINIQTTYNGTVYTAGTASVDYFTGNTSLRAPIFYDSANTSYYLNPNSTGTSLNVAGHIITSTSSRIENGRISMEADGTLDWGASKNSGTLTWDTGKIIVRGQSGNAIEFQTNGSSVAATFDTSQNATFAGTITSGAISATGMHTLLGANNTNGTLRLEPNSAKGSNVSHVHYGANGDWYIRSANNNGTVYIQDGGGTINVGGNITRTSATTGTAYIRIDNTSAGTNNYAALQLDTDQNHTYKPGLLLNSSTNTNYAGAHTLSLWQYHAYPLAFVTNNTVRLIISGSGGFDFRGSPLSSVGTISSGAITSSGDIDAAGDIYTGSANSRFKENQLRFNASGSSYIDQATTGQTLYFRTSNNSSLDTTWLEANSAGQATFGGNVIVEGNLTVSGTTTTIDTANLNVEDNNITLNYSTGDSSASANGAGITIQDAVNSTTDATILWDATNDEFDFSHPINVSGNSRIYGSGSSSNALNVYRGSDGSSAFRVLNTGEVLVSSNYFYVDASQGAYFNGDVRVRGGISNDGSNYGGDVRIHENLSISGDATLNKTDGFMYLSNVGTGNSGIYVRGIGGSNILRSHSTGSFRWEVNGAEEMALTTNYLNVNGYVRGDSFSDRNDTAFYADPASTSRLNDLNVDSVVLKTNSGVRFEHANQTDTNDGRIAAGTHGSGLNIVGVQTTSGTGRQVRIWGEVLTDGGHKYWHANNDGTGSGLDADTVDGIHASSFLRSDASDNYTAGTLSFGNGTKLLMNNGSAFNTSDGDVYASMRVINNNGSSNLDGMYIGYANANSGLTRLFGQGATNNGLYVYSNHTRIYGHTRSPIYYDLDDTSYYVDPTGTSRIRKTNLIASGSGWDDGLNLYSSDGSNRWNLLVDNGDSDAFRIAYNNSEKMRIATNGTTRFNNDVNVNAQATAYSFTQNRDSTVKVAYPDGGSANFNGSNTGAIKIRMPQSWTNTMFMMTVAVYDYSSHESFEVKLGGYNHTSGNLSGGSWHSVFAWIDSSHRVARDFTVRFGHDGTKCCIQIGETNSTWSYLKVAVTEFFGAHSNTSASQWYNGWDVSLVTTNIPTSGGGTSISQTDSNRYMSIMYDRDNTGYLIDPAGTSRTSLTHADYIGIGAANNSSGSYRLNMGGHIDMNNYEVNYLNQVHFNDGVYFYDDGNNNYLNFRYNNSNYGGIRVRNGGGTTKGYLYADNSGFGLLDNDGHWAIRTQTGASPMELRVNNVIGLHVYDNYTLSTGSARAPLFYDSNNTGYYVDPASNSQLNTVSLGSGSKLHLRGLSDGNHFLRYASTGFSSSTIDGPQLVGHQGGELGTNLGGNEYALRWDTSGNTFTRGSVVAGASGSQGTFKARYNSTDSYHGALGWNYLQLGNNGGNRINAGRTNANGYLDIYTNVTGTNTGGSHAARFDANGNSFFYVSARSPIFYDTNDTTYYVDPASTSRLNAASFIGDVDFNGGTGALDITHSEIRSAATSNWQGNPGANGKIQYHSNRWYIVADNSSNRIVQFRRDGSDKSYIDNSGRLVGTGGTGSEDWRAPIFYDSNNTSYYLNPTNESRVNTVRADALGANTTGSNSTGNGLALYGAYGGGEPTYGMMFSGRGTYGGHGPMGNSDWATYFTMNNDTSRGWIFRRQGSGNSASITAGGLATFDDSVRSPLFYDSNNTSYYVDPASTGISANFNGRIQVGTFNNSQSNAGEAWIGRASDRVQGCLTVQLGTGSGRKFEIVDSGWTTVEFEANDSGDATANNSMRAQIFYDRTNTGYYADPASTGLSFYGAGEFRGQRIMTGTGHQSGNSIRWDTSFYVVQSQHWYGHSSSQDMYLGESGNHTRVRGTMVVGTNAGATGTLYISGIATATSDFRAPVFYDSNNTGYYANPASTSRFNVAHVNEIKVDSGNGRGLRFWNSDNYKIYMSATSDSTWGGRANGETTSDYNMYFRMKGGTNRGFTFRNNTTNVAAIDGGGNGYFNSARATIFYDVSNTGYYLDPSSSNRLERVICDKFRAVGSGSNMDFEDSNGGVDMRKDASGNLVVVGNVTAYGSTSDIRLKENIETIPDALEKVKKLDGVTFDYKKDGTRSTGLIAQQLQEVLPEVVYEATDIGEEESHLAVRYGNVVGLLVEAMKEQSAQIDALRAEIESLKEN